MKLRVIVIYRIVSPTEFHCLLNKADALPALQRKKSFFLTRSKLRVQGPRLPEQPVPAADGRDGVFHRVCGRAVQRGGAASEALRRPQRRREVVSPRTLAGAAPWEHCQQRGLRGGRISGEARGAERAGRWESSSPRPVLATSAPRHLLVFCFCDT